MSNSEPKFLLKDPNSGKKTLINLIVRFNGQRLFYSTGEKIHPKNWDFVSQRAIRSKRDLQASELNFLLDRIENEVNSIFRNLKIDGSTPTPSLIREELSKKLNDRPESVKMTFFSFIEKYILEARAVKRNETIKAYSTTKQHLQSYCKLKRVSLDFDNINMEFYNYFIQYLTLELKHSQNTISKQIKNIKVFLNAATELGINKNLAFKSKKFKRPSEDVTKIYLKMEEIDALYNLDLSEDKKMDRVRDAFIIGCFTGLRFSDLSQLKPENVEGEYIKIKAQKTSEMVIVPFKGKIKEIFTKYGNNFPRVLSNQKMNDYLKIIGNMASINETIIISRLLEGKMSYQKFKKYELLSCHCSRRSFATNAYLLGIPAINIMKITGHKTDKVFQSYIRFSQEENALKLKNHAFFN